MSEQQTVSSIRIFIEQAFPAAKKLRIDDNSPLLEAGIIDSIGMLDVVAFLELTFGIKVEDEELVPESFASIRALADFVVKKMSKVSELATVQ